MKNAIAVAALAVGLAFGSATASFGGNVDAGAHPRSGVPNVAEQGAGTASGKSQSQTTNTGDHHMKQGRTSKDRMKKNKK